MQLGGGLLGRGSGQERAFRRVGIEAFARARDADREFAFRTRDVSEGGLFLCTRVGHLYPFAVGDELELELHHGGRAVCLRGTVVRAVAGGSPEALRYPQGFGIAFKAPELAERTLLSELILAEAESPPA
jgi:hypothetical protein